MCIKKYLKHYTKCIVEKLNYFCDHAFVNLIYKNMDLSKKYVFVDLSLIGDVLVSLPYYEKFFREIPDNDIQLVSLLITTNIFKKLIPNVVSINPFKFKYNPYYRINILKKIGRCEYCAITHPNRTKNMEYLCLKINSRYKIAYKGEYIYEIERKNPPLNLFSHIINNPYCNKKIVHISKHFKVFFEDLNYILFNKYKNFSISKNDYYTTFKKFNENLYTLDLKEKYNCDKYIVILTDASTPYRKYPSKDWQIILNNLPKDIKIIQIGLNKFPLKHPNLIDLTGKTTLDETMLIVMNSSLVIGNETGLTHLGYLSGVPTVCILGGGHFGRFLPWNEFNDVVKCVYNKMDCFQCGWRCKYVNLNKGEVPPCIKNIKPEKVINAINELNETYKIF